jgi:hypothetical protein
MIMKKIMNIIHPFSANSFIVHDVMKKRSGMRRRESFIVRLFIEIITFSFGFGFCIFELFYDSIFELALIGGDVHSGISCFFTVFCALGDIDIEGFFHASSIASLYELRISCLDRSLTTFLDWFRYTTSLIEIIFDF